MLKEKERVAVKGRGMENMSIARKNQDGMLPHHLGN